MAESLVRVFWVVTITITAILSLTAFMSPNWIVADGGNATCGLIKFCNTEEGGCAFPYDNYGEYAQDIPGLYLQIAAGIASFGCGIAVLTALTAAFAACFRTLVPLVFYATWVVMFLMLSAVVVVVLGFGETAAPAEETNSTLIVNTTLFEPNLPPNSCQICGPGTSPMNLENCTIGLSFILAIGSAVMSMVACGVGKVYIMPRVHDLEVS
eukprot:m.84244 g.84244  ORF g.84244 m.84244 type:complete len:211 (-) comp19702_c0_seq1:2611-3243(-)